MTNFIQYILRKSDPGLLSVQSGEKVLSADTDTVTITAVVKNKSMLFFNYKSNSSSLNANINEVRGVLTNTTTITFDRGNSSDTITIKWWVVEFKPDTPITVQHFSGTASSATEDITISAVNLSHTFPICTCNTSASVGTGKATVKPDFTSTTNCRLNFESVNTTNYGLQVITHNDWDITVYTDSAASVDVVETQIITSVTLSETMLFGYAIFTTTGNPTADEWFGYGFQAANLISASRKTAGKAADFTYYVVDTNGQVDCQHDENELIASGNSVGNTTFSAITVSNTVAQVRNMCNSVGYNNTNNDTAGNTARVNLVMNSTTNLRAERGGMPSAVMQYSVAIYDFTGA